MCFIRVQAVFCMRSIAPGVWKMPQSLRPEMNVEGTSTVRPKAKSLKSRRTGGERLKAAFENEVVRAFGN